MVAVLSFAIACDLQVIDCVGVCVGCCVGFGVVVE